jgi:hypothetical protein
MMPEMKSTPTRAAVAVISGPSYIELKLDGANWTLVLSPQEARELARMLIVAADERGKEKEPSS